MSEVVKQSRRKQDKIASNQGKLSWTWSSPLLVKQFNSMGWKVTPNMSDLQLTNVINRSARIEKEIKVLVRRKTIDRLGIVDENKKARIEVVYAQVALTGFDDNDNKVAVAYLDEFKDGIHSVNATYDDEDNLEYKKGPFHETYSKAWKGPETFDEIVGRNGYDFNLDTCQFSIDGGRGSYGGFSPTEFQQCSFEELETRGIIGWINQPVDLLITLFMIGERDSPGKSLRYFYDSLEISKRQNDQLNSARTLHEIGNVQRKQGDYPEALDNYKKSLLIKEQIDDRTGIAITLHEIGNVYRRQKGNDEKALGYYKKSLEIQTQIGNRIGMARTLHEMGNVYKKQGDYSTALDNCKKSLSMKRPLKVKYDIAITVFEIADLLINNDRYEEAIRYAIESSLLLNSMKDPLRGRAFHNLDRIKRSIEVTEFDRQFSELEPEIAKKYHLGSRRYGYDRFKDSVPSVTLTTPKPEGFISEQKLEQVLLPSMTYHEPSNINGLKRWILTGNEHPYTIPRYQRIGRTFDLQTLTDEWTSWMLKTPDGNGLGPGRSWNEASENVFLFNKDGTQVYFAIASPFQSPEIRRITLVEKAPIMVPVFHILSSSLIFPSLKNENKLLQYVIDGLSGVNLLESRFDSKEFYGCCVIRKKPLIVSNIPRKNLWGIPEDRLEASNSLMEIYHGGFWLFLKHDLFTPGDHLLEFRAKSANHETDAKMLVRVMT